MLRRTLVGLGAGLALAAVTVATATASPGGGLASGRFTVGATESPAVPRTVTETTTPSQGQTGQAKGSTAPLPASAESAISFLISRYQVSPAEAERRVQLQADSTALATKLSAEHPAEYAGMWLDQANGGVLRIGLTDPSLAPVLPGVVPFQAKRSLRDLEQTAAKVSAALAGQGEVVTDPIAGEVVVHPLASDAATLDAAKAVDPAAVRIASPTSGFEFKCDTRYCPDAPLRGGVRLDIQRDDGSVGGCSVGFHLQSAVTKKRYVLTAGHCIVAGTHTHMDSTFHQWKGPKIPVSNEDTDPLLAENDLNTQHDYAIMPFQPNAETRWLSGIDGRLYGPMPIATHDGLQITGYLPASSVVVGSVVCASGSGYTPSDPSSYVDSGAGLGYVPGTHCGTVKSVGTQILVTICARKGDSGGPLFTPDGKALGVLSGGDARTGPCVLGDPEVNRYSPISRIFERVTQRTGSTYQFELVPQPGTSTTPRLP